MSAGRVRRGNDRHDGGYGNSARHTRKGHESLRIRASSPPVSIRRQSATDRNVGRFTANTRSVGTLECPGVRPGILHVSKTKAFIRAVAGEIMELRAFQKLTLGDDTASENFVLGQAWKSMMNTVLTALAGHVHPTGTGPSGAPNNASTYTNAAGNLDEQLSDWIFGEKDVPTP